MSRVIDTEKYTQSTDTLKYIIFKGASIPLHRNIEGFWEDSFGTLYAFTEEKDSVDKNNVCGIGFFSLPKGDPRNDACRPHDYMYQSPVYQAFHYRSEADHYLKFLLKQIPGEENSLTPDLFKFISRQEGFHFWENKKTND